MGRTSWTEDEFALLTSENQYKTNNAHAWKKIKCKMKAPRQLALLQKIAAWREKKAQEKNVPKKHIMKDETLVQLCLSAHNSIENLKLNIKQKYHSLTAEDQAEIKELIQAVLAMPTEKLPQIEASPSNFTTEKNIKLDLLKILLHIIAQENNIIPKFIATTEDLLNLINNQLHPNNSKLLEGWRYTLFGKKAQYLLEGKITLGFKKGKAALLTP